MLTSDYASKDLSAKEKSHNTEVELDGYDKFDYVIQNNYDETLELKILEMLGEVK